MGVLPFSEKIAQRGRAGAQRKVLWGRWLRVGRDSPRVRLGRQVVACSRQARHELDASRRHLTNKPWDGAATRLSLRSGTTRSRRNGVGAAINRRMASYPVRSSLSTILLFTPNENLAAFMQLFKTSQKTSSPKAQGFFPSRWIRGWYQGCPLRQGSARQQDTDGNGHMDLMLAGVGPNTCPWAAGLRRAPSVALAAS
jgi:hypothetical protein